MKWYRRVDWPVALFLVLVPLVTVIGLPIVIYTEGINWGILLFTVIFAICTSMSITMGYHRLFAHRSYEAHPILRFVLLLVSTSAWQASALQWCSGHRQHHTHVDHEKDPYAITKGFWFAHFGWMLMKQPPMVFAADLQKDWMVSLQHRFYVPLANLTGFLFPALIGWWLGSFWGGLMWGGFFRIVFTQQCTYFVNSLCHYFGDQTYSDDMSARDSFFVALLTYGEGYHNFHHNFQWDYRNGVKWYHWDPTKWAICTLSFVGLAKKLRRISQQELLKARLQMEQLRLKSKGFSMENLEQLKARILTTQQQLRRLKEEYQSLRKEWTDHSHRRVDTLKNEIEIAKRDFEHSLRMWESYLKARSPMANIGVLLVAVVLASAVAPSAQAQGWTNPLNSPVGIANYREKAEKKAGSRWTLSDWLQQKERNKMMDLWLGMYAPSPYELILTGTYQNYQTSIDNPASKNNWYGTSGSVAFYALILGIEVDYENNTLESYTDASGVLNIRLMGNSNQSTHFNLFYGQRLRKAALGNLNQQFAGSELDIYIERHSGLHFNYRSFFPVRDNTFGGDISGRRVEAGLFFDINFVRLIVNYYGESFAVTPTSGTATNTERTGIQSGIRFYF